MKQLFENTKAASRTLAAISDDRRNEILLAVATAIISQKERILSAN